MLICWIVRMENHRNDCSGLFSTCYDFNSCQLVKSFTLFCHLKTHPELYSVVLTGEQCLLKKTHNLICCWSCWEPMISNNHSLDDWVSVNHLRALNRSSGRVVPVIVHWSGRKALVVVSVQWVVPLRIRRGVKGCRRLPAVIKLWDVRINIAQPGRPGSRKKG